jgi:hypothetical protein
VRLYRVEFLHSLGQNPNPSLPPARPVSPGADIAHELVRLASSRDESATTTLEIAYHLWKNSQGVSRKIVSGFVGIFYRTLRDVGLLKAERKVSGENSEFLFLRKKANCPSVWLSLFTEHKIDPGGTETPIVAALGVGVESQAPLYAARRAGPLP